MEKLELLQNILNLDELEEIARSRLPGQNFDYFAGGAGDEITLAANRQSLRNLRLRPRMLVDASNLDTSIELFGEKLPSPVMIAPMAFQKLAHERGELAMAEAAAEHGALMVVSTLATCSLEEVMTATAAGPPKWFQLYVYKDRGITRDLVTRAEEAGYKAIVVTVDSPVLGKRERDMRNSFQLPDGITIENLLEHGLKDFPATRGESGLAAYIAGLYDISLSWKDIEWIAGLSDLPVLVKGVLRGDDTHIAIESGARGISVSNHGGRQLDTTIASIDALPEVVAAVEGASATAGKIPVIFDGGIRRGTDVLKALALGADAVLLGRPLLWGLTIDGARGASRVLAIINAELRNAMTLAGAENIGAITEDLIAGSKQ
ncbi:MAG: alpha-hydroxy-acid oxidizing protein [Cyanobacteria bacterium HKST-UBA02]|nr:alpha-hydroxy-acid oxidizing protein [Cyanobacteria bacterium HKST-UBA02]